MILFAVAGYLIGCFSPGYLLVRRRTAHDIRDHGSGGTGARNVGRVLGRSGFAVVFAADCAKGALAVAGAALLGAGPAGLAATMVGVVLGHVFPAQLGFRGGKGASTALGALLVFDLAVAAAALALCALLFIVLRRATVCGIIVFALLPAVGILLGREPAVVGALTALALLLLVAHRANIVLIRSAVRSA
jgi:acyl phosphate:glycerol-3-phosphate acyltransferase